MKAKGGEISIKQTKEIAEEVIEQLKPPIGFRRKMKGKYTLNPNTLEEGSFDLDLDGQEYEGGSYYIKGDEVILASITPQQPIYNWKKKYAKGGMLEHGLRNGDEIKGAEGNMINVLAANYGGLRKVNLDKGTREEYKKGEPFIGGFRYAKGGSIYAEGGEINLPNGVFIDTRKTTQSKDEILEMYSNQGYTAIGGGSLLSDKFKRYNRDKDVYIIVGEIKYTPNDDLYRFMPIYMDKNEVAVQNYIPKNMDAKVITKIPNTDSGSIYAEGGEVEKKENNEMIIGGLAGILLGIFLNK